jgi:hypothetical protein
MQGLASGQPTMKTQKAEKVSKNKPTLRKQKDKKKNSVVYVNDSDLFPAQSKGSGEYSSSFTNQGILTSTLLSDESIPIVGETVGLGIHRPKKKFSTFVDNSNPRQEKHKPKYAFPVEIDLGSIPVSNLPKIEANSSGNYKS